jgi:hypothetical protein
MTAMFTLGGSVVPDIFLKLVPDEEMVSTGAEYNHVPAVNL